MSTVETEEALRAMIDAESSPNTRLMLKAKLARMRGDDTAAQQMEAAAAIPEAAWRTAQGKRQRQ